MRKDGLANLILTGGMERRRGRTKQQAARKDDRA